MAFSAKTLPGMLWLSALGYLSPAWSAQSVPVSRQAPEVRLSGDVVSFPIVRVKFYPFIEASVAGTKGKLMLDTGSSPSLSLNDHRIPLAGATPLGKGNYGSGQHFSTRINARVDDVRIDRFTFPVVSQVESHDSTQLEQHITADFLGWMGYGAFEGYAMLLDYASMKVTFLRGDPRDAIDTQNVVARIHAPKGIRPNIPLADGTLGTDEVDVDFDTGQNGAVYADAATKKRWLDDGVLVAEPGGTFTVRKLVVDGWPVPPLEHIDVADDPAPFATAVGTKRRNIVSIGYALFRDHPTLWDFRGHTIYVLKDARVTSRLPD